MDLREGNKNYGENLMLWDLLFGTYYDDAKRRPPVEIGIKEAMPRTFISQLVMPFRWHKFQKEAKEGKHAVMEKRPLVKRERAAPVTSTDDGMAPAEILEA
jgi:hypothetical protein